MFDYQTKSVLVAILIVIIVMIQQILIVRHAHRLSAIVRYQQFLNTLLIRMPYLRFDEFGYILCCCPNCKKEFTCLPSDYLCPFCKRPYGPTPAEVSILSATQRHCKLTQQPS